MQKVGLREFGFMGFFFVSALASGATDSNTTANGISVESQIACAKTINSHIHSFWQPADGAMICAASEARCYLASSSGTFQSFRLPTRGQYTISRMEPEIADRVQSYRNHQVILKRSAQPDVALNIFLTESVAWAWPREIQAGGDFPTVELESSTAEAFGQVATAYIDRGLEILEGNLKPKKLPPGLDLKSFRAAERKRLSGCSGFNERAKKIAGAYEKMK